MNPASYIMPEPFNEEHLSAYLDGELPAAERRQIEQWLKTDPAMQRALEEMRAVRDELQLFFKDQPFTLTNPQSFSEEVIRRTERATLADPAADASAPVNQAAANQAADNRDFIQPASTQKPAAARQTARKGWQSRLPAMVAAIAAAAMLLLLVSPQFFQQQPVAVAPAPAPVEQIPHDATADGVRAATAQPTGQPVRQPEEAGAGPSAVQPAPAAPFAGAPTGGGGVQPLARPATEPAPSSRAAAMRKSSARPTKKQTNLAGDSREATPSVIKSKTLKGASPDRHSLQLDKHRMAGSAAPGHILPSDAAAGSAAYNGVDQEQNTLAPRVEAVELADLIKQADTRQIDLQAALQSGDYELFVVTQPAPKAAMPLAAAPQDAVKAAADGSVGGHAELAFKDHPSLMNAKVHHASGPTEFLSRTIVAHLSEQYRNANGTDRLGAKHNRGGFGGGSSQPLNKDPVKKTGVAASQAPRGILNPTAPPGDNPVAPANGHDAIAGGMAADKVQADPGPAAFHAPPATSKRRHMQAIAKANSSFPQIEPGAKVLIADASQAQIKRVFAELQNNAIYVERIAFNNKPELQPMPAPRRKSARIHPEIASSPKAGAPANNPPVVQHNYNQGDAALELQLPLAGSAAPAMVKQPAAIQAPAASPAPPHPVPVKPAAAKSMRLLEPDNQHADTAEEVADEPEKSESEKSEPKAELPTRRKTDTKMVDSLPAAGDQPLAAAADGKPQNEQAGAKLAEAGKAVGIKPPRAGKANVGFAHQNNGAIQQQQQPVRLFLLVRRRPQPPTAPALKNPAGKKRKADASNTAPQK